MKTTKKNQTTQQKAAKQTMHYRMYTKQPKSLFDLIKRSVSRFFNKILSKAVTGLSAFLTRVLNG